MKKELSYRQFVNVFLMITLATGFRQIPRVVAEVEGNGGVITILYSLVFTLALTGIIVYFLRTYPGKNIYDIWKETFGTIVAKIVILLYIIWAILNATTNLGFYTYHVQSTIMPYWKNWVFLLVMLLLVYETQRKGAKTIFRLSEFILGPVLVLLLLLVLSALPMIEKENITTYGVVSPTQLKNQLAQICSLGGYLFLGMFFSDLFFTRPEEKKKGQLRIFGGVVLFTVILMVVSLICIGINGSGMTNRFFYPFYVAVKSISFFGVLERLETIVVLLSILSDFVTLAIFLLVALHGTMWLLDTKKRTGNYTFIAIIVFILTFYICRNVYVTNAFATKLLVWVNLIMEYGLPFLLFVICLLQQSRKHVSQNGS